MNKAIFRGKGAVLRAVLFVPAMIILAVFYLMLSACGGGGEKISITLDKFETEIVAGQSQQLTATVEGIEDYTIAWQSSDSAIATVNDGLVTAIAEGTATVTATVGEAQASCVVRVTSNIMPVIQPDRTTAELVDGGKSITASASVLYDGTEVEAALTWTSENESVCTVQNGTIAPVGVGETRVKISAEYEGKYAEAFILVKVNPDLAVSVSQSNVTLVTYALDTESKTEADVDVAVLSGGEEVASAKVTMDVSGDSVQASLNGGVLHIEAIAQGTSVITLSYAQGTASTQTDVTVNVIRPYIELEESFSANIRDTHAVLDFSGYDWGSLVQGIYVEDECISDGTNPCMISSEWLSMGVVGTTETIRIETEDFDIYAALQLKNDRKTIAFRNASGDSEYVETSEEVPAFAGVSEVYKWTAKTNNVWENRLSLTESVSEYAYWIFDVVLEEPLTQNITFWIANNHVVKLTPGGGTILYEPGSNYTGTEEQHAADPCIRVFDSNNRIVVGAMKADRKYTIEISLAHKGDRDIYDMGLEQTGVIYIANAFACSKEYYDAEIGPYRNTEIGTEISLTAEKNLKATHTLNFDGYAWKDNVAGLYYDGEKISDAEYPTMLDADWVASANVGLYEIEIKLSDGESVYALLDLKNSVKPVVYASTDTRYSSFEQTSDSVEALAGADVVYKWTSMLASAWDTRIKSAEDLSAYGYWIFDIVLTSSLTQDLTIWIGTNHAVYITPEGGVVLAQAGSNYSGSEADHLQENCVRIFDANNKIVIGALKPNVKYTVEVSMAHRGNGDAYAVGIGDITHAYIANAFVCTSDYYEENIGPTRDTEIGIDLNFTVEKYDAATHTMDFSAYEWKDRVEGVYIDDTRITKADNAAQLDETWIESKGAGLNVVTIRLTDGDSMEAVLTVKISFMDYVFYMPDGGSNAYYREYDGDGEALGFEAGTTVYEYYSGDVANNWNDRISTDKGLGSFDWWVFDFMLTEDLFTGDGAQSIFVIWVASGHVVEIFGDGTMKVYQQTAPHEPNCIRIYNADGTECTGAMQPNVKYTFEISLAHKGTKELYEIGAYVSTTCYFANGFACTDEYYQENIAQLHANV